MPLRDHFHPPLAQTRAWESFRSRWANSIADYLAAVLPPRYLAEVNIHLGASAGADVAEWRDDSPGDDGWANGPAGAQAVAVQTYAPPAPTAVRPAVFPEEAEVQVVDERESLRLVAVIELVSPSNKASPTARRAFATKCAAYLQRGVGVVLADIVTSRHFNLFNDLVEVMGWDEGVRMPEGAHLYAVSFRPARRGERDEIDLWCEALAVGAAVPAMPLALRGAFTLPLELGGCYEDACRRSRV